MSNIREVVHRISPLVEPLHDAFGHARHRLSQLGISSSTGKRWLRTAHYRSEVFDHLCGVDLDEWRLDRRRHGQNGAIHLGHARGDMEVRLLRAAPTCGGIPCAGANGRRRAYYRNDPYRQLGLWGQHGASSHRLLALWDEAKDEILLRVVRPVGPGTAHRGVPIDLSADLPRSRTDFEATRFDVFDEDLDDAEANYEEDEGSGSA